MASGEQNAICSHSGPLRQRYQKKLSTASYWPTAFRTNHPFKMCTNGDSTKVQISAYIHICECVCVCVYIYIYVYVCMYVCM